MKRVIVTIVTLVTIMFACPRQANAQDFNFDPAQMAQMQVDRMKESLKLTNDQAKQLLEVFKQQSAEMAKMFESGQMPDMSKMEENRKKQDEAIKKILTKEQYATYSEEQKKMREQFGGGPF